jgi:metal-responsive CopG/Arc/MetJ family transcriptional regulator
MLSLAGTRRRRGEYVRWNIQLPADLTERFDRIHENPAYRKTIFGAKSQIITSLLEQYVASLEAEIASTAHAMLEPTSRNEGNAA